MATYTLISSNVLSSSAASVTFSSIPATYTDLVLRCSTRVPDYASVSPTTILTFNGSSTTYNSTRLRGNGATATSTRQGSFIYINVPNSLNGGTTTANTFDNVEIYIPSYTANQNKPISHSFAVENNDTTAYVGVTAGSWRTSSAITSITIEPNSDTFVSTSSFYLYGISNA